MAPAASGSICIFFFFLRVHQGEKENKVHASQYLRNAMRNILNIFIRLLGLTWEPSLNISSEYTKHLLQKLKSEHKKHLLQQTKSNITSIKLTELSEYTKHLLQKLKSVYTKSLAAK